MIIGLSGKYQSGKDTVGKLIQKILYEKKPHDVVLSEWGIKKFAGKLKEMAALFLGVSVPAFENQRFKEKVLGPEWGGMTVREFLQRLGTDAVRDNLHVDAWVNAAMADYYITYDVYREGKLVIPAKSKKWIFTDTRFPNEAKAIKDRGGVLIKIVRDTGNNDPHISETALDEYTEWDYILDNNGTLEGLEERVRVMCTKLHL